MLHTLIRFSNTTTLILRLIKQSVSPSRFPQKPRFFDNVKCKSGDTLFVNRAKRISELIPFDWLDLSSSNFKLKMKVATPLHITWPVLMALQIQIESFRNTLQHFSNNMKWKFNYVKYFCKFALMSINVINVNNICLQMPTGCKLK